MKSAIIAFFILFSLLASSCFIKTNRLSFSRTIPIVSAHPDFNKDSLRCLFILEGKKRNIVVPLFIFVSDKKKFRISYQLYGKGISGREYTCSFKKLVIRDDTTVVARSKDPDLFKEEKEKGLSASAISPFDATDYLVRFEKPREMNLSLELEIDVRHKDGTIENFRLVTPLEKIQKKSFSIFNPFK